MFHLFSLQAGIELKSFIDRNSYSFQAQIGLIVKECHRCDKKNYWFFFFGVLTDMNRHHYSLFVHGDKLVLLLRREAEDASDMEVFKPAEWRWKIPEINERDEWHHYAISMNFPHVSVITGLTLLLQEIIVLSISQHILKTKIILVIDSRKLL